MQSRERRRGYLAIAVGAVLFGMWPSVAKLLLEGVHALTIAFYVQLLPGLMFLPTLPRWRFQRRDARLLVATAVAGSAFGPILYFFGLERTTAANATLLANTEALFTVLFAFALLRERINLRAYVAIATIAFGAFLVTTELRFGDVQFLGFIVGNLLLLGSAVFWALNSTGSTVLLRRIKIAPLLGFQLLAGSVVLAPIVAWSGAPFVPPATAIPGLLFLSVTGVAFFSFMYYYAFRTIGQMRTGAVLSTSSIYGLLIALTLFPDQRLSTVQIVGGALMIGALVALYAFSEPREREEAETLKPAASDGPESP